MQPVCNTKREVAAYLAYRRRGPEWEFFLQKRDANARTSANRFGLFGGGVEEGESVTDALSREIREELNYNPVAPVYFSHYEHATVSFHLFIEEVTANFEILVSVQEGEYGKFFTHQEACDEPTATDMVRLMTRQVSDYLAQKPL